jgi:uncharacterized damage-inducible protein DinB
MDLPEVWLRGPVLNIPPLLQPVAHALLQSGEEVEKITREFSEDKLWLRPAGVASVGFHLKHLAGVLDRLFTYARGETLTPQQLEYLRSEEISSTPQLTSQDMVQRFKDQIKRSLIQLENTKEETLLAPVEIGREKFPSTVLGVLFHAAEHTQRHTGQLLVTVRILQ